MLLTLKILLLALSLIYTGICLFLFLFQSRMVYLPYSVLEADPSDVGLAYEEVQLPSGPETVHAWYVPAQHPRGTVLFCHGNGGNISHRLDTLVLLHRLGMNTLLFDYRGYGRSTGTPSEQGTYADGQAAWDWLLAQGTPPERIVLLGRSLGGAVAARLAVENAPAALVLESTFTSVPDMGASLYPYLPVRLLSRFSYDTLARLPKVRCPVLIAHSPADDIVPYALGRTLFDRASEPKAFLELTGDHNSGFLLTGEAYVNGLDIFFTQALKAD